MKILRTPDGVVRAGGWLCVDGAWLWRGLKFAQEHKRRSEAAMRRRGAEEEYRDEALSPQQQNAADEILRSLGHE